MRPQRNNVPLGLCVGASVQKELEGAKGTKQFCNDSEQDEGDKIRVDVEAMSNESEECSVKLPKEKGSNRLHPWKNDLCLLCRALCCFCFKILRYACQCSM